MKIKSRSLLRSALISACALSAVNPFVMAAEPNLLWQVGQLDQPESVVSEQGGRYLYISSINGQPAELNGLGYISRVAKTGEMVDHKWIDGLDAPKGMAISNGNLYVADMKNLHVINLDTAEVIKRYSAPEAKMLNDVTVSGDGSVYISDLIGGGIYRLSNDKLEKWLDHPNLPHPNGVLCHDEGLLVANWGEGMQADFSTKTPGTLYSIDLESKQLNVLPAGYQLGNLDGVVADEDGLYISDWITGELYQLRDNERRVIGKLESGLADIGGSGNGIIYAPLMMDNRVLALKIHEYSD